VKLQAKGGSEGDAVSLELDGKKVDAPITITVRAELTVEPKTDPEFRKAVSETVEKWSNETEAELNKVVAKTKLKNGDTFRFKIDFEYREPDAGARSNYHQIKLVEPRTDKPGDPDFRSEVDVTGVPNSPTPTSGNWTYSGMVPTTMAHETLHLIGLGDRYTDVYRYNGVDYPLPATGMKPADVAKYLKAHKPPLPPPPAGKVGSKNMPGTEPCDYMGTGNELACRKISKRDLEFLDSEAGLLVTAEPGETLLDKAQDHQNFGIGFKTIVFASPGSTTVANGVSVYCIDHDRFTPLDQGFDVGPMAAQIPGYEGVSKLLQLSGAKQPELKEEVVGMQGAVWNLTDGTPLASTGFETEARALMAEAGVAEGSTGPAGLPALADPNAGSATTGAIGVDGSVLPPIPAETVATAPPPFRLYSASLYPKSLRAGGKIHADLLVGASGEVSGVDLVLQAKKGKRWRKLKTLAGKELDSGATPIQLALGQLRSGKYRIQVKASGDYGPPQTLPAAFTVRG
jgi:hypothetical protein